MQWNFRKSGMGMVLHTFFLVVALFLLDVNGPDIYDTLILLDKVKQTIFHINNGKALSRQSEQGC